MQIGLTGKRAIVTGASRGLGAAIVARMREAGAEVWGVTRQDSDLKRFNGAWDIAARAKDIFRSLDVLVNCAAIQGPVGLLDENLWISWTECLDVNLRAPTELCAIAVAWMKITKTPGSIINISGGGACNPRPGYSAYATSKAGLVRFSETIAEECRGYGIRVNCVAPGAIGKMGQNSDRDSDLERRAAECVCWLASDASRPITGRLISAVHDPWPDLPLLDVDPDMYTLRRVDSGTTAS